MIDGGGRWGAATAVALCLVASPAAATEAVRVVSRHASTHSNQGANGATTRGCPAPKTCPLYKLETYRWPMSRGVATVPFWINPLQPWVSQPDAIASIGRAAGTWTAAHPRIRFAPKGTTGSQPVLGDGVNVVGWGRVQAGVLAVANVRIVRGKVAEADIVLSSLIPWTWHGCAQRDGSCGTAEPDAGVLQRFDVQAVVSHEFGHWLGLAHLDQAAASELTMFTTPNPGERKQITLALGDVRGVRAAYPCKGCRMPRIVSP